MNRRGAVLFVNPSGSGICSPFIVDYNYRASVGTSLEDARTTTEPPSVLLRRTFVDSLVYTPEQLRHLVSTMGPTQVTLGSDYPFDMGVDDPLDRLLHFPTKPHHDIDIDAIARLADQSFTGELE